MKDHREHTNPINAPGGSVNAGGVRFTKAIHKELAITCKA